MNHKQLSDLIVSNYDKLSSALSIGKLEPKLKEFKLNDKCIIDLVFSVNFKSTYETTDNLIIELKSDEANHDIIGQIIKYKHFLSLHPFSHKRIFYVAIASQFDDYLKAELWKLGFKTVIFTLTPDAILFNEITPNISFSF